MNAEDFRKLKERVDFIEFRQDLLFQNDDLSRLLFEYKITQKQYVKIMDLMDVYRNRIRRREEVHFGEFEQRIYEIIPEQNGHYHFCELLARLFMEQGRWEEVYPALYDKMNRI